MSENTNPQISSLLRFITFIEVVVLFAAGFGLFFAPKLAGPFWPWGLLPFNARFLGAVYAAACIAAILQTIHNRWSPARLVTPMIFIFTTIIIFLSYTHIDQFDFQHWEVWIWFFLYIIIPINAGYHLWLYRNLPPADSTLPTNSGRAILFAQALVLGSYGLALIFIPSIAKLIWSWQIDDFHAQMYSVTFITPAVGAYILTKGASKTEWLTMGLTQAILGLFPIIGVIIVDMTVKRVNWSSATTWLWMLLFIAIFSVSLWMFKESQMKRAPNS